MKRQQAPHKVRRNGASSKRRIVVLVAGALVGLVAFVGLYGPMVLNPTNAGWLLSGGDLSQHYLGWVFFRHSEWAWPLGAIKDLAYPIGSSVVYTDSIPIVAIFFKAFSGILPSTFQYFGWWGLLCFMLQGALGGLIAYRFYKHPLVTTLASVLFVMAPVMVMRMYMHTALASQWIILLAIAAVLYRHRLPRLWQQAAVWGGMFFLAAGIHAYFLPMVAAIFLIYLVVSFDSWRRVAVLAGACMLVALVTFWAVGGFVTRDVSGGELGKYGSDLDTFINPFGYSYFIREIPASAGAYEGMGYLGLGVLAMVLCAVVVFLMSQKTWKLRAIGWRPMITTLIVLGVFVFSVGTKWYLDGRLLFRIPMPDSIESVLGIFRSTGRLIWPLVYGITAAALGYLLLQLQRVSLLRAALVIGVFAGLQIFDIAASNAMMQRSTDITYEAGRPAPGVVSLGRSSHLVVLDADVSDRDLLQLEQVAAANRMTISNAYLARKSEHSIEAMTVREAAALEAGKPLPSTTYVTDDKHTLDSILKQPTRYTVYSWGKFTFLQD